MNPNICTFYIVRHGQTDWNKKHLIQGQTDIPLNEEGKLQVKGLAEEFRSIHFDAVFSSDLTRTRQTAEILALEKKLAVGATHLLRERTFGKLEGKATSELRAVHAELIKLTDEEIKKFKPYEGYETDEVVIGKTITFLRETAIAYPGKTVLVVSHSANMRALLVHLGYGNYQEVGPGTIKNTAYIKLESDGVDFFVKETKGIQKIQPTS